MIFSSQIRIACQNEEEPQTSHTLPVPLIENTSDNKNWLFISSILFFRYYEPNWGENRN